MGKKKKARVSSEDCKSAPTEESEAGEASAPKEKSLYEILGVERTASQQEIKKAYYKLALRLHPDKNPGDDEAKDKFQVLQKVISILGDEEKRSLYDQTGSVDDDILVGNAADNLQEYFRSMYKKVTEADIEEFEANYRGSDSEKKDLKDLFAKYNGELNSTKAYQKWAKKISLIKPPRDPLARKTKSKMNAETDLVALISQRQSSRKEHFNSVLSSIMAKHDPAGDPEPSEEEFQAAKQRLESKKRSKGRKR